MHNFRGLLLNPSIDKLAVGSELAEAGSVQIPNFFEQFAAEETFACLEQQVVWEMAFRNGAEAMTKTAAQLVYDAARSASISWCCYRASENGLSVRLLSLPYGRCVHQ